MSTLRPIGQLRDGSPVWPMSGGDGEGETEPAQATPAATAPPAAPAATVTLTPDLIRNTPEFKALEKQNRDLARANGEATRTAEEARIAAETARQDAESDRAERQQAEIRAELGEDGYAAYQRIANLSETDPVAAAREFAASRLAQSQPGEQPPAVGTLGAVPARPPAPGMRLDGNQPLGAATTGNDWDADAAEMEKDFMAVAKRVQDPFQRNRVTDRERGDAMVKGILSAAIRAGRRPVDREPTASIRVD